MLRSSSRETYEKRRDEMFQQPQWQCDKLQTYFMSSLDDAVNYASSYYLRSLGVSKPEKLLTNNPAENLNSQMARFRAKTGREPPKTLDEAILELKVFEDVKARDVEKGFYGLDPYKLKAEYQYLKKRLVIIQKSI
jgi:hypothetical protein